jgi:hypothetical protein
MEDHKKNVRKNQLRSYDGLKVTQMQEEEIKEVDGV